MEKKNQLYILPTLVGNHFAKVSFNLWMSKGAYNMFALVIFFFSNDWQSKHVIIGFIQATKTTIQALTKSLTKLLSKYGLRKKIITYVKDEGYNFHAMTDALKSIVNCESIGLEEGF
jgi:hypothetical protein